MPQDLYGYLQTLAFAKNCSLETQVITLLYQSKQQQKTCEQQTNLLADIYHSRVVLPKNAPDSVALLREDRAR